MWVRNKPGKDKSGFSSGKPNSHLALITSESSLACFVADLPRPVWQRIVDTTENSLWSTRHQQQRTRPFVYKQLPALHQARYLDGKSIDPGSSFPAYCAASTYFLPQIWGGTAVLGLQTQPRNERRNFTNY